MATGKLKMKNTHCPACKTRLTVREFFGFTTLYGTRRIKPCPHCGVMLRWARNPLMFMNLGSIVLIVAAVSVFLLSERFFDAWNIPTILLLVGAVIALVSFPLFHFELVVGDKS